MRLVRVLAVIGAVAATTALPLSGAAHATTSGPSVDEASLYNGGYLCSATTPPRQLNDLADMEAFGSDPDPSANTLTYTFAIWPAADPTAERDLSVTREPGTLATVGARDGVALSDGTTYAWHVKIGDANGTSAWSQTCNFTYDVTAPGSPAISSSNYPKDTWGPVGQLAHFRVDANGDPDVIGFQYDWGSVLSVFTCSLYAGPQHQLVCPEVLDEPGVVAADAPGGTAAVSLSPPDWGPQTLTVRAVDRAGNVSAETQYKIYAPDSAPTVTVTGGRVCGDTAAFTFTPHPGVPHVTAYRYALTGSSSSKEVAANADGTASATISVARKSALFFNVRSIGADGFVSAANYAYFSVDQAPGVASDIYVDSSEPVGGIGVNGTFTFSPPTNFGDVSEYRYRFGNGVVQSVSADQPGEGGVLQWAPTRSGPYRMTVTAIPQDGSAPSCPATYKFDVAGLATSAPPSTGSSSSTPPPSPAPSSADGNRTARAYDTSGKALADDPTLRRGDHILIRLAGFSPGADIGIALDSSTTDLGSVTADEHGQARYAFAVPDEIVPGQHGLAFSSDADTSTFGFKIAASDPGSAGRVATTGGNVARYVVWGAALILTGLLLTTFSGLRRRMRGRHV